MKTQSAVCPHRWVIESPHGPISHARCRLCGLEKDFSNVASEDGKRGIYSLPKDFINTRSDDWRVYRGLNKNRGLRI